MILTTKLVQPVKCCVRWPAPVSGLYCSHAKPVFSHWSKTLVTRLARRLVYRVRARAWCRPGEVAMIYLREACVSDQRGGAMKAEGIGGNGPLT